MSRLRAPAQAIQQSAPPPGREREVSAVAEHATVRVNRRTRDPVVADQPERQGRVESDRVPHLVHFQNLAVDPQPPAQEPGEEPLADRRRTHPIVGY